MKKAYFISDLHLGATYNDESKAVERDVVKFFDSIREDAAEIYLLGDILDYWFEYRYVVPRGFVRFFGKLAELADRGIKIIWMIGNHDIWIFDYLPEELGIEVVDGVLEKEIMGVPFCIQHGDAIGGSRKFRVMRRFFRNKTCQKLYSAIHPRWTVGFALGCSKRSRISKKEMPAEAGELIVKIKDWCEQQIAEGNPAKYYLFGHLHRRYEMELKPGKQLVVIPDWPTTREYGVFDGNLFSFYKW